MKPIKTEHWTIGPVAASFVGLAFIAAMTAFVWLITT